MFRQISQTNEVMPGLWREIDAWRSEHSDQIRLGQFLSITGFRDVLARCYMSQEFYRKYGHPPPPDMEHARWGADAYLQIDPYFPLYMLTAAWRPGQDIVRFDPDVYQSLLETKNVGKVPSILFTRFPAWAVYVEALGLKIFGQETDGFLAGCVDDHLYFACPTGVINGEQIWRMASFSSRANFDKGMIMIDMPDDLRPYSPVGKKETDPGFHAVLSMLAYICAYGLADRQGRSSFNGYPAPKKTKKGWRLFPPDKPRTRHLGHGFGEQIRQSREYCESRPHGSPAPHIRSAHWHHFWTGPKNGERELVVRWLPPIAVNMQEDYGEEEMVTSSLNMSM